MMRRSYLEAILLGALIGTARTRRGRRAIHVLRDRPIVYRVTLNGTGLVLERDHALIEDVTIVNAPAAGVSA